MFHEVRVNILGMNGKIETLKRKIETKERNQNVRTEKYNISKKSHWMS